MNFFDIYEFTLAYRSALKQGLNTFKFNGEIFTVKYAKYLIKKTKLH